MHDECEDRVLLLCRHLCPISQPSAGGAGPGPAEPIPSELTRAASHPLRPGPSSASVPDADKRWRISTSRDGTQRKPAPRSSLAVAVDSSRRCFRAPRKTSPSVASAWFLKPFPSGFPDLGSVCNLDFPLLRRLPSGQHGGSAEQRSRQGRRSQSGWSTQIGGVGAESLGGAWYWPLLRTVKRVQGETLPGMWKASRRWGYNEASWTGRAE
ncbi:hypothetical protein CMUS01_03351 [Colletotrichum musicola]|uniref:Uncharacterized protein n=1 Tax=Colletotrichum musicola TaxID=2175873 RepID=A0A8H6U678_9PEZI|nr:hypothetical protein CMUS01_03351 [Colletotrichum musicola]